mgnify:CR=1 FL=1
MNNIIKLKNNVTLLIVPTKTKKLIHLSTHFGFGSFSEKDEENELTHLSEHFMGRFTSKLYDSYQNIENEISKRGGITNAYVNNYATVVYINGFIEDLNYYADIMSNMVSNVFVEPSLFEQEKKAVIQELKIIQNDPKIDFNMKICNYMMKNKHLCNISKSIQNIKKTNIDDIYTFLSRKIRGSNIIISCSCPKDKILYVENILKKHFGKINYSAEKNHSYDILYKPISKKVIWIKNNSKNNDVQICLYNNENIEMLSPKMIALYYFKKIFFNFESGVFYKSLRDKLGIIYYIHFNIDIDFYCSKNSTYKIFTQIDKKHIPTFLTEIKTILLNLNVTKSEVQKAKRKFLIEYEYDIFKSLTSVNKHILQFLKSGKKVVSNKEIMKQKTNIDFEILKKEIFEIRDSILNHSNFFYYSHNNCDKIIKDSMF